MRININNIEVEKALLEIANIYGKSPTAMIYQLIRDNNNTLAQNKDANNYDKTPTDRRSNK